MNSYGGSCVALQRHSGQLITVLAIGIQWYFETANFKYTVVRFLTAWLRHVPKQASSSVGNVHEAWLSYCNLLFMMKLKRPPIFFFSRRSLHAILSNWNHNTVNSFITARNWQFFMSEEQNFRQLAKYSSTKYSIPNYGQWKALSKKKNESFSATKLL